MEELNWGVLGPGKIAKSFASDLSLVDGSVISAVASRSLERAQTFAEAYEINRAYGDYKSLIQDSDVDIVYIATPHNSHMEYAIEAMEAGKHVLCEKPIGINKSQVQKMIDVARRNGVFLMEALWSRFNPSIEEVLAKINEGIIGEINYVNVDFSVYRDFPEDGRMLNMELAGGSLLDMGIYPVFLSYAVLGYPDQILSTAQFHKTGADIQTAAILKYKKAVANILSGFNTQSDMIAKIHGTAGRITINSRWHEAQGYQIIKGEEVIDHKLPTLGRGYSYEIMECMSCVSKGLVESPKWTHQNSLDVVGIMDEIRNQIGLKYPVE